MDNQDSKRVTKPKKDGTVISLKLRANLDDKLKAYVEVMKTTQTEIIETALSHYFEKIENIKIENGIHKDILKTKDSFLIPKELYAKQLGLNLIEMETFIKQHKIKIVTLNSSDNSDEETQYLVLQINDPKTILGTVLQLQEQIEHLKRVVAEDRHKISSLERTVTSLIKK